MALATHAKKIGRFTYKVTVLPTSEATELLETISAAVVPSAGAMVHSAGVAERMTQTFAFTAAGAIRGIAPALKDKLVSKTLLEAFRPCTSFTDSEQPGVEPELASDEVFEEHFAGRLAEMAEWIGFCLEVNFGDFIEIIRGRLAPLVKTLESLAMAADAADAEDETEALSDPSPPESTG